MTYLCRENLKRLIADLLNELESADLRAKPAVFLKLDGLLHGRMTDALKLSQRCAPEHVINAQTGEGLFILSRLTRELLGPGHLRGRRGRAVPDVHLRPALEQ